MDESPEEKKKPHPDRPLECTECKKPITVYYTEIVGNTKNVTGMCSECPQLQRRLKGVSHQEALAVSAQGVAGLACGECGATLDELKVGHTVGCSHCYEVFGDLIIEEMMKSKKLSPGVMSKRRSAPLHIGRVPGETREISPSLKLIALNEALEETLKHEDYEQAAWLRDQIKAITEEPEENDASEG